MSLSYQTVKHLKTHTSRCNETKQITNYINNYEDIIVTLNTLISNRFYRTKYVNPETVFAKKERV